jgi:hypothetical protein
MKAPVFCLVSATVLAGCAAVPFRYEGPDAATLSGEFLSASKTMVMEVNGLRRDLGFSAVEFKVRPGVLRVGVNLHNISGQLFGAECFELDVAPGSYHQFSAQTQTDGFLVSVYEGKGDGRKLIGKARVPFRSINAEIKQYCPTEAKT